MATVLAPPPSPPLRDRRVPLRGCRLVSHPRPAVGPGSIVPLRRRLVTRPASVGATNKGTNLENDALISIITMKWGSLKTSLVLFYIRFVGLNGGRCMLVFLWSCCCLSGEVPSQRRLWLTPDSGGGGLVGL